LQHLVARELPATAADAPASKRHRLASSQWVRQFEEWADSFPNAEHISDEALSRENLYPDRLSVRILVDTNILVRS
jgi:hypothetical protein